MPAEKQHINERAVNRQPGHRPGVGANSQPSTSGACAPQMKNMYELQRKMYDLQRRTYDLQENAPKNIGKQGAPEGNIERRRTTPSDDERR